MAPPSLPTVSRSGPVLICLDFSSVSRYSLLAEGTSVGLFFPLAIVAGYVLGKWAGAGLSLGQAPALFGAGLGVAAGFWNLYRFVRRMEARNHRE